MTYSGRDCSQTPPSLSTRDVNDPGPATWVSADELAVADSAMEGARAAWRVVVGVEVVVVTSDKGMVEMASRLAAHSLRVPQASAGQHSGAGTVVHILDAQQDVRSDDIVSQELMASRLWAREEGCGLVCRHGAAQNFPDEEYIAEQVQDFVHMRCVQTVHLRWALTLSCIVAVKLQGSSCLAALRADRGRERARPGAVGDLTAHRRSRVGLYCAPILRTRRCVVEEGVAVGRRSHSALT